MLWESSYFGKHFLRDSLCIGIHSSSGIILLWGVITLRDSLFSGNHHTAGFILLWGSLFVGNRYSLGVIIHWESLIDFFVGLFAIAFKLVFLQRVFCFSMGLNAIISISNRTINVTLNQQRTKIFKITKCSPPDPLFCQDSTSNTPY